MPLLEKMADKKADAVKAKTEGNKHFKAKNYEKAIESYTKAVELDPDKVIIGVLRESFPSTKVLKPPYFFRMSTFQTEPTSTWRWRSGRRLRRMQTRRSSWGKTTGRNTTEELRPESD